MRIPLIGGAYVAKSIIASAQRCVNLYPEPNPVDAPVPATHYPTPGERLLSAGPGSKTRGMYRASNGDLYMVVGNTVYYVAPDWSRTALGTISLGTSRCSMADNGLVLLLVDGTPNGYAIDLVTRSFGSIPVINFYGADRVDYVDTFFLLNQPGTAAMYISLSEVNYTMLTGGTAFDSLDIAEKTGYPDPIQGIIVMHREAWLIGTLTTEVWYDTGAPDFAFGPLPGAFIEHGTVAKYSIAAQDLSVYWLSQDKQGQKMIMRGSAYVAKRISTHAIEQEIATYGDVSDAFGYCYQQEGHAFYMLTFPSANKTWCYDQATELFHERAWLDANGNLTRHRSNFCAFAYGTNVVSDWENGNLYAFELNTYTDNGNPIPRIRSFPHMVEDFNRIAYNGFTADMEVGNDDGSVDGSTSDNPPMVSLRWSDTRGKSWGNALTQSLGALGQFLTTLQWSRLGMARDRVFELSWSVPTKTALQGCFIDVTPAKT